MLMTNITLCLQPGVPLHVWNHEDRWCIEDPCRAHRLASQERHDQSHNNKTICRIFMWIQRVSDYYNPICVCWKKNETAPLRTVALSCSLIICLPECGFNATTRGSQSQKCISVDWLINLYSHNMNNYILFILMTGRCTNVWMGTLVTVAELSCLKLSVMHSLAILQKS